MKTNWKVGVGLLALVLAAGLWLTLSPVGPALGQGGAGGGGGVGRYAVVMTDGTHLVVTDNQANKVFFYAIDQGGKPGDDLKLRGTLNLADVGKPSITPTKPK
jgi:hypothetical protein